VSRSSKGVRATATFGEFWFIGQRKGDDQTGKKGLSFHAEFLHA
jgi:hypothetical protein